MIKHFHFSRWRTACAWWNVGECQRLSVGDNIDKYTSFLISCFILLVLEYNIVKLFFASSLHFSHTSWNLSLFPYN